MGWNLILCFVNVVVFLCLIGSTQYGQENAFKKDEHHLLMKLHTLDLVLLVHGDLKWHFEIFEGTHWACQHTCQHVLSACVGIEWSGQFLSFLPTHSWWPLQVLDKSVSSQLVKLSMHSNTWVTFWEGLLDNCKDGVCSFSIKGLLHQEWQKASRGTPFFFYGVVIKQLAATPAWSCYGYFILEPPFTWHLEHVQIVLLLKTFFFCHNYWMSCEKSQFLAWNLISLL